MRAWLALIGLVSVLAAGAARAAVDSPQTDMLKELRDAQALRLLSYLVMRAFCENELCRYRQKKRSFKLYAKRHGLAENGADDDVVFGAFSSVTVGADAWRKLNDLQGARVDHIRIAAVTR